jgi:cytochrome c biogenesis protein
MATSESEVKVETVSASPVVQIRKAKKGDSLIDGVLRVLSSVRFGIIMLSILLICCMIGMLIMQVEVEDFPKYYEKLTPSQRFLYTKLGLFNIYHAWYFTLLLSITALNIILASIDRFPTAWQYIIKPKVNASPNFIRAQNYSAVVQGEETPDNLAKKIFTSWRGGSRIQAAVTYARLMVVLSLLILYLSFFLLFEHTIFFWLAIVVVSGLTVAFLIRGLRFDVRLTKDNDRFTVFGQLNAWNRLGAYVVHIALLTICLGGFLTSRYDVGGMMEIVPGEASRSFVTLKSTVEGPQNGQAQLPFEIECLDLQQKLVRPEGGLEATNTIDWLSYIRIKDGNFQQDALVHLNNPYDYKGYRLFQSKFTAFGYARSIDVRFEPLNGEPAREITIPRNGVVNVDGIGEVMYQNFFPDFQITTSGPTSQSPDYKNPAAQLEIKTPSGKKRGAFAFNSQLAERFLSDTKGQGSDQENMLLVNGHKVILKDFEKAAVGHTLAIQYDPGRVPAYIGFLMLCAALCGVFFFSHQRIWAVVEAKGAGSVVHFGGNTNRNKPAFEERFNSLVEEVKGGIKNE